MTTTLSEGVKVPDVGSTDWADDLETNWNLLNTALAQQGSWAKTNEAQTFTGVQTFSDGIVGSLQGTANMAVSDEDGNSITTTYATKTELSTLSDTVGTKANDNAVVHKTGAETIAGAKTFSDTLTSVNIVPSATDTYSLGSASYQYNAVYGKSYYYNGTQWGLDQYNWWTLAQFFAQNSIHVRNVEPGVAPSSDVAAGIRFENANASYSFCDILGRVSTSGTTYVNLTASNKFTDGVLDTNGIKVSRNLQIGVRNDGSGFIYTDCGWRNNLVPHSIEPNLNLGTSTNKWKTLNGINPGALSLPDVSSGDPIDKTNWDLTGATSNTYTATVDGWISIGVRYNYLTYVSVIIASADTTIYAEQTMVPNPQNTGVPLYHFVCVPIKAGGVARITAICSQITFANFYPCQGNV